MHCLAYFFTKEFFTKNNVTVVPTHPIVLFPRLKIKLKGRHFDTPVVTEVEWQAALNILKEHNFHDAFENGRSTGNGAYAWKGTTLRVMVASKPKVTFNQHQSLKLWVTLQAFGIFKITQELRTVFLPSKNLTNA
jgi:hypothetical protein